MLPPLPSRSSDANKGSCGRVLIVGGSRGMAGAPCLSARAAYRSGAGLVKVGVPESIWDIVATKLDECTTFGLPETSAGTFKSLERIWDDESAWSDVAVIGPGIGGGNASTLAEVRKCVKQFPQALVLDADALNAFAAGSLEEMGEAREKRKSLRPLVLTPHPGEMARLLKMPINKIQNDREHAARTCQKLTHGGVVVLKGEGTVVTDGDRVYVNPNGNPGMATGGTGDVLSGIVAALIGQNMDGFEAACLGVYLHGLAGDLAAKRLGMWSLIAGDLIDELPAAFLAHFNASAKKLAPKRSPPANS